jgi:hypothetical protein
MIYPSIHRYNAPYRGPRDKRELGNVMTSIWYDINVLYDSCDVQRLNSDNNVKYAMSGSETPTLNGSTSPSLNNEEVSYRDINDMVHSIDSMSTLLNNALKNL